MRAELYPPLQEGQACERFEIGLDVFSAALVGSVVGQGVASLGEEVGAQRRVVHGEGGEHRDVSPVADVGGDFLSPFVDGYVRPEPDSVEGGFEADGACADHRTTGISQLHARPFFICIR